MLSLLLPLLSFSVVAAVQVGDDPLMTPYELHWLNCEGGCDVGNFCRHNTPHLNTSICTPCPTESVVLCSLIDDMNDASIQDCYTQCNYRRSAGDACSSHNASTGCAPGLLFCNYNNTEDAAAATSVAGSFSGTCQACETTNLTNCLALPNPQAQQACLECPLLCAPLYRIFLNGVYTYSETIVGSPSQNNVTDRPLVNCTKALRQQLAKKKSSTTETDDDDASSMIVCPNNNDDDAAAAAAAANDSAMVCLFEIDYHELRQDVAIDLCQASGGVAALFAAPTTTQATAAGGARPPRVFVTMYESQIPSASIRLPATATTAEANHHQTFNNEETTTTSTSSLGQVSMTLLEDFCSQEQTCSADIPCMGNADAYCFLGFCWPCPRNLETGALDPLVCFFGQGGAAQSSFADAAWDIEQITSCASSCQAELRYDDCKFCPDDVSVLEFGSGLAQGQEQCSFCPSADEMLYPDRSINLFAGGNNDDMKCWQVYLFFNVVELSADSQNCRLAQMLNYICGCKGGPGYGGANSEPKKAVLVWLPRVMAVLSLAGSLFIIYDAFQPSATNPHRRQKLWNQLMICLSVFDAIGALAYMFTSLPIPASDYIYGAYGNAATCTAQGFFIQVGTISCFTNISLAVYYYLVIVRGWTERRLQHDAKKWLFACPIVVGMIFALAGIPFYDNMILWCNNTAPWWPDLPVALAILSATVIMCIVCWDVYQKEKVSARWRAGGSSTGGRRANNNDLSNRVVWQAFWFLMAFYLTWPAYLALQYSWARGKALTNYGLILAAGTMAPLQGFWNCIVYVRPRYFSSPGRGRTGVEAHRSSWIPTTITSGLRSLSMSWTFKKSFNGMSYYKKASFFGMRPSATNVSKTEHTSSHERPMIPQGSGHDGVAGNLLGSDESSTTTGPNMSSSYYERIDRNSCHEPTIREVPSADDEQDSQRPPPASPPPPPRRMILSLSTEESKLASTDSDVIDALVNSGRGSADVTAEVSFSTEEEEEEEAVQQAPPPQQQSRPVEGLGGKSSVQEMEERLHEHLVRNTPPPRPTSARVLEGSGGFMQAAAAAPFPSL